jgi:hypothetical protein
MVAPYFIKREAIKQRLNQIERWRNFADKHGLHYQSPAKGDVSYSPGIIQGEYGGRSIEINSDHDDIRPYARVPHTSLKLKIRNRAGIRLRVRVLEGLLPGILSGRHAGDIGYLYQGTAENFHSGLTELLTDSAYKVRDQQPVLYNLNLDDDSLTLKFIDRRDLKEDELEALLTLSEEIAVSADSSWSVMPQPMAGEFRLQVEVPEKVLAMHRRLNPAAVPSTDTILRMALVLIAASILWYLYLFIKSGWDALCCGPCLVAIVGIVGPVLLYIYRAFHIRSLFRRGIRVTGEITALDFSGRRSGWVSYRYRVRGREFTANDKIKRSSLTETLRVGRKVDVVVDPNWLDKSLIVELYD